MTVNINKITEYTKYKEDAVDNKESLLLAIYK